MNERLMKAASLPAPVCQEWFGGAPPLSVKQIDGGFSGARVYRCEGPGGWVVLRQWPSGVGRQRIGEIHRVMRAARAQGCYSVPRLQSTRSGAHLLSAGGRCWDCSAWTPGQAWKEGDAALPPVEAIRAGCNAIASFHQSVANLAFGEGLASALQSRWRRLAEVETWLAAPLQYQALPSIHQPRHRGDVAPVWLASAERQLKAIWRRDGGSLRARLKWFLQETFPLQYVLRDVHREHVLFENRRVSGLIDFDAVRIDSPAADIARFVSSFFDIAQGTVSIGAAEKMATEHSGKPSLSTLWDAAMAGYRAERPFSDQELQLAKFLAKLGPFLSLVNWAVWSTSQPKEFSSPPETIASRAEHLSHCLQTTFDVG